jgi:N-hydroxyarylamine O-acetyltransferase
VHLDAYFRRIGFVGPHPANLETLRAILRGQAQAIPFENLDVLLNRGVRLDLSSIERKLVHDRRGGYCFEQNTLLAAVLRALGFTVTTLMARVRWQVPVGVTMPQTHMVLRVDLHGQPWLADAGFGGLGLDAPIRLDTEQEQGAGPEPRRLVRDGRQLLQQIRLGDTWNDVYTFTLDEAAPIDFEVANWYTSTHPNSRFRQNLVVARLAEGRRIAVQNSDFTTRHADGRAERRPIESPDALLTLLASEFGLNFPPGTRFGTAPVPWPV